MHTKAVRAGALLSCAGLLNAVLNQRTLLRPADRPTLADEPVWVCVPARNEVDNIAHIVADLQKQRNVAQLRVLVLDDASTDATFSIARETAGEDHRVHVERSAKEPPAGWLGKPAACQRLAEVALAAGEDGVLVFVDADVRLSPDAISAGVGLLRTNRLDLVCPWPSQTASSLAERLIQPLQQWSWLTTLPLGAAARSLRPSMAAVCGQFLVIDASAYAAVGGHTAVRDRVLDDLELARALRRKGFRTAPADGAQLARCRMYPGAAELREGYGKSLWIAFGSAPAVATLFALLTLTYVWPPSAAILATGRTRIWGLAGYLAAVGSRVVSARIARTQTIPDALAHPLSVLALLGLTVDSHRRQRRGALWWKGRHLA